MFKARFLVLLLAIAAIRSAVAADRPKLVVVIAVDQLRGDLPLRYEDRLGKGGFRYFLDHGTWYAAAFLLHARSETVVGHTTIATGAYPSRHGMVTNKWYDRTTGKFITDVEDPNYTGVPSGKGASPAAILTTTLSDELSLNTNGRAKVYAVSGKDRGAVPLGGHTGKSFWYSDTTGCFVSSTFYYPTKELPEWATEWCRRGVANQFSDGKWILSQKPAEYVYDGFTNTYDPGTPPAINMETLDNPPYNYNHTFAHTFGTAFLYRMLTLAPELDEVTLDFAKQVVRSEHLGHNPQNVPDYLGISFTSTDYIGHWFSHASLESEDNVLRLDRTIADLMAFLDEEVGLANTLVVLTADHGGPDYPEMLRKMKVLEPKKPGSDNPLEPGPGRVNAAVIRAKGEEAVTNKYGDPKLIREYAHPYFYLDRTLIEAKHLDRVEVERVVATAVMKVDGVMVAIASDDPDSAETDPELIAQVRRNYHPARSGDVYVIQNPQWQVDNPPDSKDQPLLQHGSPWTYDTFVPIAFAGGGVKPSMVYRKVATVDIAPTLAAILRTRYPSGSVGAPLVEIAGGNN
jgi:predicted AlkP superfamily pyrophosphatase or phosphodiesterase